MAQAVKICPICNAQNPRGAATCYACGTDLRAVVAQDPDRNGAVRELDYDFRHGETDLQERAIGGGIASFFVVLLLLGLCGGLFGLIAWQAELLPEEMAEMLPMASQTPFEEPQSAADQTSTIDAMERAITQMPTVTTGPPTRTRTFTPAPTFTPSLTPTRGPCVVTLQSGSTVLEAAMSCGHRSMDVLQEVYRLNNIANPSQVRAGQQLTIPWPTSTPDPNAALPSAPAASGPANATNPDSVSSVLVVDESIQAFQATITPTLPPGIQWHRVSQGDTMYSIIVNYNADVKIISELNREINFARCDLGERFGGQECIVALSVGQQLRVPAPTPTPTLSPTPDPNATATPTATPTVNIPQVFSPSDRAFFYANELITLRWMPTGTLRSTESYRVDVVDLTSDTTYTALTQELFFTIPRDWIGTTRQRHEFSWQVGVVDNNATDDIRYQTDPSIFVWQGEVESVQNP